MAGDVATKEAMGHFLSNTRHFVVPFDDSYLTTSNSISREWHFCGGKKIVSRFEAYRRALMSLPNTICNRFKLHGRRANCTWMLTVTYTCIFRDRSLED